MKTKKGFVLPLTLMVMLIVFFLSSTMVVLLNNQTSNANRGITHLEKHTQILQITNNFVDMAAQQFADYCLSNGFALTSAAPVVFENENLKLILTEEVTLKTLVISTCFNNQTLAKVEVEGEQVITWQIFTEE